MQEINAVLKTKDTNCIGILSDQEEAAIASNLIEYSYIVKPTADNAVLMSSLCVRYFVHLLLMYCTRFVFTW